MDVARLKTRRSHRARRLRHSIFALLAWYSVTAGAANAQTTAATSGSCPGGTPAPAGLMKATVTGSLLAATQSQQTLAGSLFAQQSWNVGSAAEPSCGWDYQLTRVDVSASYDGKKGATGPVNITRNHGALLQHLMFLKSNASFAYVFCDLYHNNSLGLELRQAYGGGVGYARDAYEAGVDLRFINEEFLPPDLEQQLVGIGLWGSYDISLDWLVPGGNLILSAKVVPVLDESNAWFGNSAADIELPFNSGVWALTVQINDNYMDNAPSGFKRNYFKAAVGLAYVRK
jgi:hypothetical protein